MAVQTPASTTRDLHGARVVVTGANGFVGSNLVGRLLADRCDVVGLVRPTADLRFLQDLSPVTIVATELHDTERLRRAFDRADVVLHCAARASDWGPMSAFRRANVEGTRHVTEAAAAAACSRMVLVGSTVVYGFCGHVDTDESAPHAPDPFPYCVTKLAAERLAAQLARARGLPLTVVRPGNVFGPNDRVTTVHLYRFLRAGRFAHVDHGRALTCPTYVENLTDAIVRAAAVPAAAGDDFIVTDGLRVTWCEYVDAICRSLDVRPPKLSVPAGVAGTAAVAMEGLWRLLRARAAPTLTRYRIRQVRRDYHFAIQKARRVLDWSPRVDLDEALARTARWYATAGAP